MKGFQDKNPKVCKFSRTLRSSIFLFEERMGFAPQPFVVS
jgi:hypothetical protein